MDPRAGHPPGRPSEPSTNHQRSLRGRDLDVSEPWQLRVETFTLVGESARAVLAVFSPAAT